MRLAVASYNVHRCIGRDGRHDVARIARVLAELDADLVALQEVSARSGRPGDVDQAAHLARALGMRAIPGPTLRSGRAEIGNALLTRLPVARLDRIDLTQPGQEPRGAIDAEIETDCASLRVLTTHLGLRWAERRVQVARLLEALRTRRAPCTVLLGDMNDWLPFRGAVRPLDAWFGRSPAPRTFPAARRLLALDRVWASPRDALEEVVAHDSREARAASDHLPLRCTIRLTAARRASSRAW